MIQMIYLETGALIMNTLGMMIVLHILLLEIFLKTINMIYESCFKITGKVMAV